MIFKISTPFRSHAGAAFNDDYVVLIPIDKNIEGYVIDELFVRIPNNMDEVFNNQFSNLVELMTGSGVSQMLTRDNIRRLNRNARDRRRRRQLALTEPQWVTDILPLHSDRRATNPRPLDASVTIDTDDGPVNIDVPQDLLNLIAENV